MTRSLRPIAAPFVVAPPAGARVRARLRVDATDTRVLFALGRYLGSCERADLAQRCREGRLDAKGRATSRAVRKRGLTPLSSSRWAGAITRTSEDAWQLGYRNLVTEQRTLRSKIARMQRRLAVPVGECRGRVIGYATLDERYQRLKRLQALQHRLLKVEDRLNQAKVSICRGGKSLARTHHHLDEADMTEAEWHKRWDARRLFIGADGERDKAWGNETIRWHPVERWVEVKLPAPLAQMSNRPHGRYRLSSPVTFSYRENDVAAQAESAALHYDITFEPVKSRWYLDASWKYVTGEVPSIEELQRRRVLAVDLNAGHLAAMMVDPSGNPLEEPITVPLALTGLVASTRDGHLRAAISTLTLVAKKSGCPAIVIEDLDFAEARETGREHNERRPSRGRRGKRFRQLVSGIPTAGFRDRLVQMATNAGLAVIAVDPAYTSRWGAEHWLDPLQKISPEASGHHAAALVIGRRGLGQRARRRERCDSTPPVDGRERATYSAAWTTSASVDLPEPRLREPRTHQARGQPRLQQRTQPAEWHPRGDQVTQDRSGSPTERDSIPLSGEER